MILLAVTIAVVGLIYMIYFYAPADVTPNADQLATDAKSNRVFHELLTNDSTLREGFPVDGLVLCFEKIPRDHMRRRNGETAGYSPADQCRLFGIDPSLAVLTKHGLAESARKLAISTLDDPKPLMLTHWFEKANGEVHTRYNVYASLETENYDLPAEAITQYRQIATLVCNALQTGQYTHLIIASTGWNNQPTSSVDSYTQWLNYTKKAAEEDGQVFRPFFIGITWSSFWKTPFLSAFNKANDADELGMTHLNYLLWKELLPTLKAANSRVPAVTIGHSFGARLISRMTHSRFMLNAVDTSTAVDLEIDWQGAYPVSRYLEPEGNNGGLYTIDAPVKRHVITSSEGDKAVKIPFYSDYVGNSTSVNVVKSKPRTSALRYRFASVDCTGRPAQTPAQPALVFVPASIFVADHNDVRDTEAGRFMWEWLKRIGQ